MSRRTEYILFADETKKTPKNPYFCFAGFIIKRCDYEDILVPRITELKQKHFGKTSIIFHYTDMKNNKGDFVNFKDNTVRNKFWTEFVGILSSLNITTIGVYFDQTKMKEIYDNGSTTNYDIAFRFLLENYMHFLKINDGVGAICIESRTFNENMFLERNQFDYIEKGSIYFDKKETSAHLSSISFTIKGDNCIGLQIADIIPARFMRIVNRQSDNYLLNKLFHKKLYCYGTDKENILGLKNLL